ncbi:MAG: signal peptide peptidase SppA [Caulobacterales bacterium]|nr:signal peptide peptidase SppA [Caulobacterales bacterium]
MKQFFLTVAGVFVGLALFLIGVPFLLVAMAAGAAKPAAAPARTVLELDLRSNFSDQGDSNPLAAFGAGGESLMTVVDTLKAAQNDDRVKGIIVRLPEGGFTPAAADELRLAFKRFRASGKPMIAHSQGLMASGAVTSTYMLGAATGDIWMQPLSSFQVTGMSADNVFFKRALDKYGVKAEYEQRAEYKTAVNPYLQSDYTAAHRESELSWMTSIYQTAVNAAASDRKADAAALARTLEAGPYSAERAKALGLVDHLGLPQEARDALLTKAGSGAKLVEFEDYEARTRRDRAQAGRGRPAIALVGAEGAIVTGEGGGGGPFTADATIYSDDVAEALKEATEDKDVKAIVLRVSSPGGSDTASEQILAGVKAAKAAGKPVVVSMGAYAASGGYWISSQASSIVAEPTTLTGSIGVFGGKVTFGDAVSRFGVDMRQLTVGGDYSSAFSSGKGFDPAQRAAFAAWMDEIYAGFISRVAEGRKLPPERVRELARGRVWTGAQAKELGLVDELGGIEEAVAKAKSLAKIDGEVRVKKIGGPGSPLEALERLMGVSESSAKTLAAAAWVLGDPRATRILDAVTEARLRDQGARVLAPRPF